MFDSEMSIRIVLAIFVCNVVLLHSVNAYMDENSDEADADLNSQFDLLDLFKTYVERSKENRREVNDPFENWTGRWMPDRPDDPTPPPKVLSKSKSEEEDHHVKMGVKNSECDDGKMNLTVDWDYSPVNRTCYGEKILPDYSIRPLLYCEQIPKAYRAQHKCMREEINYDDVIPTYGPHRPIWPVYGEYKFLPKQRWIHSLEHGAVVMLYHPCANPLEVKRLKSLVTGCLRRHIISPYNLLDEDRPLALLTWGCRLTMSYVNPEIVRHFIRKKSLRGPEQLSDDGAYDDGILIKAKTVTDIDDTTLCPGN